MPESERQECLRWAGEGALSSAVRYRPMEDAGCAGKAVALEGKPDTRFAKTAVSVDSRINDLNLLADQGGIRPRRAHRDASAIDVTDDPAPPTAVFTYVDDGAADNVLCLVLHPGRRSTWPVHRAAPLQHSALKPQ